MKGHQEPKEGKLKLPEWLDHLLRGSFFTPCSFHHSFRKNIFCLDCLDTLCSQCLLSNSHSHSHHRLLQVRRYVYHDVVRLEDADKLIDCSHVQPYISNGAKVVFLNQRPTSRLINHSGNICAACDRILLHPFLFCCISCKVDHILDKEGLEGLYGCLRRCDPLHLNGFVAVNAGLLTPDSVLEPSSSVSVSVRSSSNSSGDGAMNANAVVSNAAAISTATATDSGRVQQLFPRRKRTPKFPIFRVGSVLSDWLPGRDEKQHVNRRKRAPQRSALL